MRPLPGLLLVAAVGLGIGLAVGIGLRQPAPPMPAPASASASAPAVPDDELQAAVLRQLRQDPAFGALRLQVDVAGARVRLQGAAPDTATRRRIAEQVRSVPGVQAVDNQLSVQLPAVPAR